MKRDNEWASIINIKKTVPLIICKNESSNKLRSCFSLHRWFVPFIWQDFSGGKIVEDSGVGFMSPVGEAWWQNNGCVHVKFIGATRTKWRWNKSRFQSVFWPIIRVSDILKYTPSQFCDFPEFRSSFSAISCFPTLADYGKVLLPKQNNFMSIDLNRLSLK